MIISIRTSLQAISHRLVNFRKYDLRRTITALFAYI